MHAALHSTSQHGTAHHSTGGEGAAALPKQTHVYVSDLYTILVRPLPLLLCAISCIGTWPRTQRVPRCAVAGCAAQLDGMLEGGNRLNQELLAAAAAEAGHLASTAALNTSMPWGTLSWQGAGPAPERSGNSIRGM